MVKPENRENKVNAMAADALAPGDARSSATMVSTTQDKQLIFFLQHLFVEKWQKM